MVGFFEKYNVNLNAKDVTPGLFLQQVSGNECEADFSKLMSQSALDKVDSAPRHYFMALSARPD